MAKLTDKIAFEGETLTETIAAPLGTTAVVVKIGGNTKVSVSCTKRVGADDLWDFTANAATLGNLTGDMRWIAMATTTAGDIVVASGEFYLRPLVSKFRAVVNAIDECLKSWDTNPNHTVTVGEISITAKTRDDLIKARAFWQGRASADEAGTNVTSGPRRLKVCF